MQQQADFAKVVTVVSWSTGANNTAGCGGLTVTPLTLYRDWVMQTAKAWSR